MPSGAGGRQKVFWRQELIGHVEQVQARTGPLTEHFRFTPPGPWNISPLPSEPSPISVPHRPLGTLCWHNHSHASRQGGHSDRSFPSLASRSHGDQWGSCGSLRSSHFENSRNTCQVWAHHQHDTRHSASLAPPLSSAHQLAQLHSASALSLPRSPAQLKQLGLCLPVLPTLSTESLKVPTDYLP